MAIPGSGFFPQGGNCALRGKKGEKK